jgi:branched-chain amino acid transport system permease protein
MYEIVLLTVISIYAIAAMGLNITMGYAGQVNLGQAAFLGIGAFASAILSKIFALPFWICLPLAGLTSMICGITLGVISTRLKQDFLAITTIGINFIAESVFRYYDLFGGSFGIMDIQRPYIFGKNLDDFGYLIIVLIVLTICILFNVWIERSWMGTAFECIKEDEHAAEGVGINTKKFKIIAFSIGTAYGGLAGALLAHYKTYIVYSDFAFAVSIQILTMTVLGGLANVFGALLGSSIIILLPEIFRPLLQYRLIMYALMLIILLRFQPQGIIGKGSFFTRKFNQIFHRERVVVNEVSIRNE